MEVHLSNGTVVSYRVVLCEVVTLVVSSFPPVDAKLSLVDTVPDPVKPHVHCFGSTLFHGIVTFSRR